MDRIGTQTVSVFVDALASKTPAPGGGAAACVAGAVAAAQAEMVVAYSVGKQAEHDAALAAALEEFARLRGVLIELADEDAAAYGAYSALKKSGAGEAEVSAAAARVLLAPRSALAACTAVCERVAALVGKTNRHLDSDLIVAASLAEGAAAACAASVRVNMPLAANETERSAIESETGGLVLRAREARGAVERALGVPGGDATGAG